MSAQRIPARLKQALLPRLKQARKHTGLSTRDYAELMGVTQRTVFRWEASTKVPDLAMLCRIASLAGVSLFWLLHDVDEARGEIGQEGLRG